VLLADAIRPVEVTPGDAERAIREMEDAGVELATLESVEVDR
jgi:hypothetical protein